MRSTVAISTFALALGLAAGLAGCNNRSVGWVVPQDALIRMAEAEEQDAQPAPATDSRDPLASDMRSAARSDDPQFSGRPATPAFGTPGDPRFANNFTLFGELRGGPTPAAPFDEVGNLRRVSFTVEGADFDIDVAPGGKWVVFASTQHRRTADLYVKPVDGATVTQLTSDPAEDTMPAISPDGRSVCFASNRAGNWDLYIKPIEGGQPVQLTSSPAHELHPSWSPDGRQIVFCAMSEQSGQWEMVVIDVNKPANRRFIGHGLFPEFSPDGKKIAFQRARDRATRWFSVWTMDYEDGQGGRPTQIIAADNAAVINPTWSPDGKRLAFATVVDPNRGEGGKGVRSADLWMVNLDGTNKVRLTGDRFCNLQPAWGDDGAVYFVSNRSGTDNLWAVKPSERSIALQSGDEPIDDAQASAPTDAE